jgi:hypothetical protein
MWTRLWNRCRFLFRRSRAAIGMTRLGVVVGHAPVTEKKPTLFQAHEPGYSVPMFSLRTPFETGSTRAASASRAEARALRGSAGPSGRACLEECRPWGHDH